MLDVCRYCSKRLDIKIKGKKRTACDSCSSNSRRTFFKTRCVVYKGGKCEHCGYSKSTRALCFHHTDASKKDFTVANAYYKPWKQQVEELDKCVLLCANCHHEEHERLDAEITGVKKQKMYERFAAKEKAIHEYAATHKVSYEEAEIVCNHRFISGELRKVNLRKYCEVCSRLLVRSAEGQRCSAHVVRTKIEWPPVDLIQKMAETMPVTAIGARLGVTGNAVLRHMRDKGAPLPKVGRGSWTKKKAAQRRQHKQT